MLTKIRVSHVSTVEKLAGSIDNKPIVCAALKQHTPSVQWMSYGDNGATKQRDDRAESRERQADAKWRCYCGSVIVLCC